MLTDEGGDRDKVQVTSCCWLSKPQIKNFERKRRNLHREDDKVIPNFHMCATSVALPIIKLKNDLNCISENKHINRLRDKKGKEKGKNINILNEDEICSMLLRSKAFNETWKMVNHFMNSFIYNYVNDMINKEVNFLNTNLCLKDDKLSLLIVKTQTCAFVNLLQYRILTEKLKIVNRCFSVRGEDHQDGCQDGYKDGCQDDLPHNFSRDSPGGVLTRKNAEGQSIMYEPLQNRKNITSCIIHVYSHDSVENIIIRIIKKVKRNHFLRIDKNSVSDIFRKIVKRKNGVLIIFVKNYFKLKSSTFSSLILYLNHLKEVNSLNISIVITNSCIQSALNNLDPFIKKHVHVNIFNLYLNYFNLIEHIIFSPIFNNILFKLREYNSLIDHIFFCNQDITFLKIKYILYMFIRDFYDKKILSFLNIPLTYFNKKVDDDIRQKTYKIEEYTKRFNNFKSDIIHSFNSIDVHNIHEKYVLLLYASNFYQMHINYLKCKGNLHTFYIINKQRVKKKGSNDSMSICGEGEEFAKSRKGRRITFPTDCKSGIQREDKVKKINGSVENSDNRKSQRKAKSDAKLDDHARGETCTGADDKPGGKELDECVHTGKKKNKRVLCKSSELLGKDSNSVSEQIVKRQKIKNDPFYNCIKHFNFMKCEQGQRCSGDGCSANGKSSYIDEDGHEGGNRILSFHDRIKGVIALPNQHSEENALNEKHNENFKCDDNWGNTDKKRDTCKTAKRNNETIMENRETPMHEIILMPQKDCTKKKLQNSEHFKNYYFQNYALYNLSESLSPINRLVNNEFVDDCNCVKQYIINNLSTHMKLEHNLDCFGMIKKEWDNNEYIKIYKYEKMVTQLDTYLYSKQKDIGSRGKKKVNTNDKIKSELVMNEKESLQKTLLLYLHKCLVQSISKKMIIFLYKKKKYNICLTIVNMILKYIPTYTSLRKRIKILKELFKNYEQKYGIQNVEDLKRASDEIEKELKQTLNTMCDILINLYVNKIYILKKIMDDIYIFLKDVSYVCKLEKYVDKKMYSSSLNMSLFLQKLNLLILYLDISIDLKKRKESNKCHDESEKMGNLVTLNRNIFPISSEISTKTTNYCLHTNHNNEYCLTPKSVERYDQVDNHTNGQVKNIYEHVSRMTTNTTGCDSETCSSAYKSTPGHGENSSIADKICFNCGSNCIYLAVNDGEAEMCEESEKKKRRSTTVANYLHRGGSSNVDLTCIEFLLVFFCEYFYFLLIPCIYLLPLANVCITHDHATEFFDILNINLQMKLLHILNYNRIEVKDLTCLNMSTSLNYNTFTAIKNAILRRGDVKKKEAHFGNQLASKNSEITKISVDNIENNGLMEDIVIIFRIIQCMKTKHINVCSMFVEFIRIKLRWPREEGGRDSDDGSSSDNDSANVRRSICKGRNNERRNAHRSSDSAKELVPHGCCETFQELFYQFIIAIMSLFYFMKIIHIPSSFVKGREETELSSSFKHDSQCSNLEEKDEVTTENTGVQNGENGDQPELKSPSVNEIEKVHAKEKLLANDDETTSSFIGCVNPAAEQRYKNYVFDMLSNINIRKLIFGKSYLS
ncbi:conserved Plasmodium protein, unknown function [Plasmodium ovale]|uniref:Uncharacterized protein n=2 Tax=Plasmodium ovale TaxID=36330 RepID=A0A1A8VNJ3_PLAOA|nr:hypothetical protein, conserved [Plasmodium ovale curtisi]SBS85224.1 hypothetical protein, conserved [Plasmodium ovale curtisi]SCQ16109.1 conserved Plasmodium protein, unknown function [Plasmodium ovale]